ncbi:MAG: HAMP domain-containing histidine kinase [Planctomycetes bacterium]|nr:HAMP domain-containing histidine kinase [Planctomycetota bacterium]
MNPLRWVRTRLSVRLTLTMLLVSLGPLVIGGVLVLRILEGSLRAQLKAEREQLARVSAANVDHHIQRALGKLRVLASVVPQSFDQAQSQEYQVRQQDYQQFSAEQLKQRLAQVVEPTFEFDDLLFMNRLIAPNRAQAQRQALSTKQQAALSLWNSDNVFDAADAQSQMLAQTRAGCDYAASKILRVEELMFLPMAVPVREGRDVFGILKGQLNLAPVADMLRQVGREGGGRTICLSDADGAVIAQSGPPPSGEVLTTIQDVQHGGWRVVVSEPAAAALEPLMKARLQAIGLMGASGALALTLSLFLSARILRPIRRLTSVADTMRAGALGLRSGIARDDEIGRLADSFDRMAAALQELDQLKSEFVAHVSHELRTPLTAMQLSVANLQDGVAGAMDPRQAEILSRVRHDIERLIRLVNEVLDVARIEAGKLELDCSRIDLAEVARAVVANLEPLAREKGVGLGCEAETSWIRGDRMRLHQVVTNLVDNAIKFTPAGGRARVEVKAGRVRVRDTGCGIPAERLPRVYDRFAKAGAMNAGAGLGLSITKKIIELHGGTISVESEVGRGTTFTVMLPCLDSSS